MLRGHYVYYGITGNYDEMFDYYQYVQEMLFWTKISRSQRKNKYIDVMNKVLEVEPLIRPRIYVNLWT